MNESLRHLSSTCQSRSDSAEMTHESFPIWSPGLPFLMLWSMIVFLIWWFTSVNNVKASLTYSWLYKLFKTQAVFITQVACFTIYQAGFFSCLMFSEFKPETQGQIWGPRSPHWTLLTSPCFFWMSKSIKQIAWFQDSALVVSKTMKSFL